MRTGWSDTAKRAAATDASDMEAKRSRFLPTLSISSAAAMLPGRLAADTKNASCTQAGAAGGQRVRAGRRVGVCVWGVRTWYTDILTPSFLNSSEIQTSSP